MNKYQVVLKINDRVWDSIRDSEDAALFRVCDHIKKDYCSHVAVVGELAQYKLMSDTDLTDVKHFLEEQGFEIRVQPFEQWN